MFDRNEAMEEAIRLIQTVASERKLEKIYDSISKARLLLGKVTLDCSSKLKKKTKDNCS